MPAVSTRHTGLPYVINHKRNGLTGCVLLIILCWADWLGAQQVISPAEGLITDATQYGNGAVMTLKWTSPEEADVLDFGIFVGSQPGGWDIQRFTHMNRYLGSDPHREQEALSFGIPADGSAFYVRFFWRTSTAYFTFIDYEYIAPTFDSDTDNDGIYDANDPSPLDSYDSLDTDNDGRANNIDGDDDNDGLSDNEENILGTDPFSADSDGDGMTDGYEHNYGLDPLDAGDAGIDQDADGLTNLEESVAGSNPDDVDSDDDGLDDKTEVDRGRNPTVDERAVINIIFSSE